MKMSFWLSSLFLVLFGFTSNSWAQDGERVPPCMQIKKACESGGFKKGKARDCMKKITSGESVSGVSVSSAVVSQCKEKHEK